MMRGWLHLTVASLATALAVTGRHGLSPTPVVYFALFTFVFPYWHGESRRPYHTISFHDTHHTHTTSLCTGTLYSRSSRGFTVERG